MEEYENKFTHMIRMGNSDQVPIRIRRRRIPFAKVDEFSRMIDEMIANKLIRKSDSPWNSPVLLVAKKDGSIRMTVDYRHLNNVTVKDAHPLPQNEEMFVKLSCPHGLIECARNVLTISTSSVLVHIIQKRTV
jgi:hypothetical protein